MISHCSNMNYSQYQEWLFNNFDIELKSLCGLIHSEQHYVLSFAYNFHDVQYNKCPDCLAHEDLPLLVLSFTDKQDV